MLKWRSNSKFENDLELQHKKLFQINNELHDIINGKMNFEGFRRNDEVDYLINRFADFTEYHHEFEQAFYDANSKNHDKIDEEYKEFASFLSSLNKDDYSDKTLKEITNSFSEWIDNHIQTNKI